MDEAKRESVWEYPRPPRLERTERLLRVVHAGLVVAETRRGMRVLETSHPPVYYLPPEDVARQVMRPSARGGSFCEFKGVASYWNLDVNGAHRADGDGHRGCAGGAGGGVELRGAEQRVRRA